MFSSRLLTTAALYRGPNGEAEHAGRKCFRNALSICTSLRRIAMPYSSKRNRSKEREMEAVARNRRKIIAVRLSGRDLWSFPF